MLADLLISDKPRFAIRLAGQPPEHRPIVDIQHPFDVVLFGIVQRLAAGLEHLVCREMRTGDQQRLAGCDVLFVDVFGAQSHVCAVFAVEHQRECFAILQAQQHHGGQAFGIALDGADVTALASQRLKQKTPHVVVAHPAEHRRPETQPGGAEGDIGR